MHLLLIALFGILLQGPIVVSPDGPLTSIQAAVMQAAPGSTIEVRPGIYNERLAIDKSLTLLGVEQPVIDGGGEGTVILITAPHVTFQGFTVRHSGNVLQDENGGIETQAPYSVIADNRLEHVLFGIYLNQAAHSSVRNNTVHGLDLPSAQRGDLIRFWYSSDSQLTGNTVEGGRDVVIWFSNQVEIRDNVIRNGRYGLHFMYCDDNTLQANTLEGNSVGAYLMNSKDLKVIGNTLARNRGPSGYGLGLKDMDGLLIEDNRFVDNRVGIYLDNPPAASGVNDTVHRNLFAHNDIGIDFLPLVRNTTLWENIFWENAEQISIRGGGQLLGNTWEQAGRGNYWSDYVGYDANEDTIGDIPYRSSSLFENLMDRYPGLRLFHLGPAADAIDLAARAFPLTQPRIKMTDAHPLMSAPLLPPGPGLPLPARGPALLTALVLLAIPVVILWISRPRTRRLPRPGTQKRGVLV